MQITFKAASILSVAIIARFPEDFMFQLTTEEFNDLKC